MQKEVKEKEENRHKTTRRGRKNIEKRIRNKHLKRVRHKGKQTTSNVHLYTTDYINSISNLKMHHTFGLGIFKDKNDIIQMIKDLYPIIKNRENAISGNEKFNEELEPIEFLHWILKRYDDTRQDYEEWTVSYNEEKKKFEIIYIYEYDDIGINGRSQSLEFLLKVKEKNEALYELFVGYIRLIIDSISVPMWYNNSNFDYNLEYIEQTAKDYLEDDTEEDKEIGKSHLECVKKYKKPGGDAFELACSINSSKMIKSLFKKKIKNVKGKNKGERMIIDFLINNIGLINEKEKLYSFWHIDREESDGNPVTFEDYACLMFSYDEKDIFFKHSNEMYSMNANEYGVIPFRDYLVEGSNKKESELPRKYVKMLDDLYEIVNHYS